MNEFEYFEVERSHGRVSTISLSDDQQVVYDKMVDWIHGDRDLLTVGGYAGTGKTTLIAKLIADYPELRFACCAYTGKAANVLSQKVPIDVSTIHRLSYKPEVLKNGEVIFHRKPREEFQADVIVVDEASMVNADLYNDLASFDIPILAVGDHGQLPPVEGQSVLMDNPMLRLEKIHRQAEGSPIIQLSKLVREKGRIPIPPPKGIRHISKNMLQRELVERVVKGEDFTDFAVLCYTNYTRNAVNQIVRRARYGESVKNDDVQVGDVVVCLRNMPPVYNGMRGVVTKVKKSPGYAIDLEVRYPEDGIIHRGPAVGPQFGRDKTFRDSAELRAAGVKVFDFKNAGAFYDYGYGMTVHKAQGSGFKTVYLVREKPRAVDEDAWARWAYTGVTRAVEELVIVAA